jgi:hypothetical protein
MKKKSKPPDSCACALPTALSSLKPTMVLMMYLTTHRLPTVIYLSLCHLLIYAYYDVCYYVYPCTLYNAVRTVLHQGVTSPVLGLPQEVTSPNVSMYLRVRELQQTYESMHQMMMPSL